MSALYSPPDLSAGDLEALSRRDAVQLILDEITVIAGQPTQDDATALMLLASSPLARHAKAPKRWMQDMLGSLREDQRQTALASAIAQTQTSGVAADSDRLWARITPPGLYRLPGGYLVQEAPDGRRSLWIIDPEGPRVLGPCLFPVEELEDGSIRVKGWDRWGREVDVSIALAKLLGRPKALAPLLAQHGARMEDIDGWAGMVATILSQNSLQIPDPAPPLSLEEERELLAQALRALAGEGEARRRRVRSLEAITVPAGEFTHTWGPISLLDKRRWAGAGWLIRDSEGRYETVIRSGGTVVRVLAFAEAAVFATPDPVGSFAPIA